MVCTFQYCWVPVKIMCQCMYIIWFLLEVSERGVIANRKTLQ